VFLSAFRRAHNVRPYLKCFAPIERTIQIRSCTPAADCRRYIKFGSFYRINHFVKNRKLKGMPQRAFPTARLAGLSASTPRFPRLPLKGEPDAGAVHIHPAAERRRCNTCPKGISSIHRAHCKRPNNVI